MTGAMKRAVGAERALLSSRAALASVTLALVLLLAKGWAAIVTNSTAMLGSLADTALDLVASLATLAGVWIAARPADSGHRFGHGKAEALVALGQVVLIGLSALWIAWRAIDRLINGGATAEMEFGIGVSLFAIAATLLLL
jgi:ferrous-iron efflux pump FieF